MPHYKGNNYLPITNTSDNVLARIVNNKLHTEPICRAGGFSESVVINLAFELGIHLKVIVIIFR